MLQSFPIRHRLDCVIMSLLAVYAQTKSWMQIVSISSGSGNVSGARSKVEKLLPSLAAKGVLNVNKVRNPNVSPWPTFSS